MAIDLIYRGSSGNVKAVNGKVGYVVLTAEDVGALPEDTVIPSIEGLVTEQLLYAEKDDLVNRMSEYVLEPWEVERGQTLVCKSNLEGQPVEWEAVDFPSDEHINGLINNALGVIENGTY